MADGPDGWQWDESLYAGAARYYLAGRMPYPAELGEFRVVTFAQSFHWVDRLKVARLVRTVLEPEGGRVDDRPLR